MKIEGKLRKSLEKRWVMRFKTSHPDGERYDGAVMYLTKSFVILRAMEAFEFYATLLFPREVIVGYRDNKYDACANAIMQRNGQLDTLALPEWLKQCETIPDVLLAMQQQEIWPSVETLNKRRSKYASGLYIGPILGVSKRYFGIHCYDAAGKWEAEYKLKNKHIIAIQFDDAYTGYFNEYMKNCVGLPPQTESESD